MKAISSVVVLVAALVIVSGCDSGTNIKLVEVKPAPGVDPGTVLKSTPQQPKRAPGRGLAGSPPIDMNNPNR